MHRITFLFVVAILYSSFYADSNWPRFRGSTAMGVAEDDSRLPDRWSRTENVARQMEVSGWGWSCPVVWGSKELELHFAKGSGSTFKRADCAT
jgi:hypothetical protein